MAIGVPRLTRAQVSLEGDLRSLYKDMARAKGLTSRTMKEIGAQSARPNIQLDLTKIDRQMSQVKRELEILDETYTNPEVDLDDSTFERKRRELEYQLKLLTRNRDIVINVDVDKLGVMREELTKLNEQAGQSKLEGWLNDLGRIRIQAGPTSLSVRQLGISLATLGPILTNLIGGVTALAGSLGQALLGGAVVGAGALAGFAASAVGAALAIKPLFTQLKTVSTAQTAYNTAVADYGKNSKEAKTASDKLHQTIAALPAGVQKLETAWQGLKASFMSRTSDIRSSFVQDATDAIHTARSLLPTFTRETTHAFSAFSTGWHAWMQGLRSPEAQHLLQNIMANFTKSIPPAMDALGNLATILGRIASTGSDFWPQLVRDFDHWTQDLERASRDSSNLHDTIGGFVAQFKAWIALMHDAGAVLIDVLGGGASSGEKLVKALDDTLQRWDRFLNTKSGQDQMHGFFSESVTMTEHLASTLGKVVTIFWNLSRATQPFADGVVLFAKFVGDIGSFVSGWKPLYRIIEATGVAMAAVWSISKVTKMIDLVTALAVRWGLVDTAASEAAVAEGAATVAGGAGAAAGAGEAAVAARGAAGAAGAAEATSAGGVILPAGAEAAGVGAEAAGAGGLAAVGAPEVLAGAGIAAGVGAGVVAMGEGIKGTVGDINSVGDAAKKVAAYTVLGPGAFIARGLRELPVFGGAIGGVEDKVSSLAHQVPVLGDAFDTVFGSGGGGPSPKSSIHDLIDALDQAQKKIHNVGGTLKQQGIDPNGTISDAVDHLRAKFGGLGEAGLAMSKKQRAAFMEVARASKNSGEISGKWFDHLKRVIGLDIGSISKDAGVGSRALKAMGDVVHNLGNKTVPQAMNTMREKYGSLLTAGTQLSKGQRKDFMDIAKQAQGMGLITRKQLSNIDDAMTNSQQKWNDNAKKIAKVTGQSWQDVARSTDGMTTTVSKDYGGMVEVTGKGLDLLTSNTNQALKSVGINKEINFHSQHPGSATSDAPKPTSGHPNRKGGIETVPGHGLGDAHPVSAMVESGEGLAVVNRNAMPFVNWLNHEFPRDNPMARKGAFLGGLRRGGGGTVDEMPGVNMSQGQEPSILKDLYSLSSELHKTVYVISGYRSPAHSVAVGGFADDPHTKGEAADIGVGSASRDSMFSVQEKQLRAVGLYRPFYPPSASEVNHVQLLAGGAKGALTGAAAPQLKRVLIDGPKGAMTDLAQAHVDKYWHAAQAYINKHMPTPAGGAVGYISGGAGKVEKQMWEVLKANGWDKVGASGVIGNAYGESALNPGAVGTGGGGLFGFTTSPISLADLHAYAAAQNKPWTDVGLQMEFMLNHGGEALRGRMNAQGSPASAATLFMNDWERPGIPRLDVRIAAAQRAFAAGYREGGIAMPPYGGSFAGGGTVPGPEGAARTIIAHGGETVSARHMQPVHLTMPSPRWSIHVHGDIIPDPDWGGDPVEAVLDDDRFYDAVNGEIDSHDTLTGNSAFAQ